MDTFTYLKNFIRDRNVASITPTSSFCVRKVCNKINFDRSELIVEYGPGTGVFTNYLLRRMRNDARLILIERNKNFNAILEKNFHDPRVTIVNGSAENILNTLMERRECKADCILSGIPFMLLPKDIKHRILVNTYQALKKGGKFLVYQTCFQTENHLKVHLDQYFPLVRTKFEFLNIPPLRVYEAIK